MIKNDIIFDEKSGISLEEQQEILTHINGITEKNRNLLSQNSNQNQNKKIKIKAKKSGAFFPLSVNIAAVIILLAGAVFLVLFNGNIDIQTRTGNAVYNLTERALIEEIRKDTAEKIAAKDMEITTIASRLEEVDNRLFILQSGSQDMTLEQLDTQDNLLALQKIYRDELFMLQEERAQILENSRQREALLRAQLEERSREFAAIEQRNTDDLDSARSELNRLAAEQETIAAIDAQFSGSFTVINELIQNKQYSQAALALENLKQFNNNNTLSSARSFETRRESYNQTINSMEMLIAEMQNSGININDSLIRYTAVLEETIADMQSTIDTFNSGNISQARQLGELEGSVSSLLGAVSSLETDITDKDAFITFLETAVLALEVNIEERNRTISNLNTAVSTLEANVTDRNRTITNLNTANAALESNITEKDITITNLNSAVSVLETGITEGNRTISVLEAEKTQLVQTVANLESINSENEQEITDLRNQIANIRQVLQSLTN